jgi:hypothetical protein
MLCVCAHLFVANRRFLQSASHETLTFTMPTRNMRVQLPSTNASSFNGGPLLDRMTRTSLLITMVAAAAPLDAQVRTLTFDAGDPIGGLAVGSVLGNQYAAFGVTFTPNFFNGLGGPTGSWATNTDMTVVSSTGGDVGGLGTPALVSGNIVRSFNGWLGENGDPSFQATFTEFVDYVSIDLAGIATPSSTRLFAYNGATLLGTVTSTTATGQQRLEFTAGAGQQITHVGVAPGDYFDWVGFDNFTYGTAITTVPEPSTWSMMGAGLLLLGFVTRRRRNGARLA